MNNTESKKLTAKEKRELEEKNKVVTSEEEVEAYFGSEGDQANGVDTQIREVEEGSDEDVKPETHEFKVSEDFDSEIDDVIPGYLDDEDEMASKDTVETKIYDNTISSLLKKEIVKSSNEETVIRQYYGTVKATATTKIKVLDDISDPSQLNSIINKSKARMKGIVSVPLPNLGIVLDNVSASTAQFVEAYSANPENIQPKNFIERQELILSNVVGTSPRVEPSKLSKVLSYADYSMILLGHAAATIPEIELMFDCEKDPSVKIPEETGCSESFIVKTPTIDIVENGQEIIDKMNEVSKIPTDQRPATTKRTLKIDSTGFEIELSFPSFYENKHILQEIKDAVNTRKVGREIYSAIPILQCIRKVKVDNIESSNPVIIYRLLIEFLNESEMELLGQNVKEMYEQIVTPKFAATAKCPCCGRSIRKEIPSVESVVFWSCWLSRQREEHLKRENISKPGEILS